MSIMSDDSTEAKLPTCNLCKKSFSHKFSLRNHCQSKHGLTGRVESKHGDQVSKPFECTLCSQSFRLQSSLIQHNESKHAFDVPVASVKPTKDAEPSPVSQSPAVDGTAPIKQEDLKQEVEDQDPESAVLKRPLCDRTFNRQFALDQHNTDEHGLEKEDSNDKEASTLKDTKCMICNKSFVHQRALENHHRDKHVLECLSCRKVFSSGFALGQHKRVKHPVGRTNPADNPGDRVTGDSAGIRGRRQKATKPENSKAEDSEKQEKKPAGAPPKRWKCDFCSSTFHHFDLLEQHVIRHNLWSDQGPVTVLKCDFCDKTFYSDDELEEHMETTYRLHSDDGWQDSDEESNDEYDEDDEEEDEESGEESDEQSDEEPVKEPVKKPVKELVKEPVKELVKELVKEPVEKSAEKPVAGPPPPSFKCQTCDEAFYFAVLLHEHERKVGHVPLATSEKPVKIPSAGPPPPTIKCEFCDEAFYYAAMLLEHKQKARHGPWDGSMYMAAREPVQLPQHKCEDCNEAFYYIGKLDDHQQKLVHGIWATEKNKPVEKPVEKPTAESKAENASISVFKCTDCGRPYRDVEPFMDHMYANHGRQVKHPNKYLREVAPEDAAGPSKSVMSGFRCKPCNEPFRSQYLLAKHWERAHADTWWSLFDEDNVSEVSLSYSEFQDFDNYDKDDMLSDLREISSWSSKKNTISCMTCWKKFKTSSQMLDHVEMGKCHSYIDTRSIEWAIKMSDQSVVSRCYSEDEFQCPECEATFGSLSSLIRHAEGTKCSADITQAPLNDFMSEVRWRMIEAELF